METPKFQGFFELAILYSGGGGPDPGCLLGAGFVVEYGVIFLMSAFYLDI
jgi:hypothetical protein